MKIPSNLNYISLSIFYLIAGLYSGTRKLLQGRWTKLPSFLRQTMGEG